MSVLILGSRLVESSLVNRLLGQNLLSSLAAVWLGLPGFGFGCSVGAWADADYFESKVRPILVNACAECHGAEKQKGGLRLDTVSGIRAGGDSGAVVVAGQAKGSLLLRAVRRQDEDLKMPPDQVLPVDQVAILEAWIRSGAVLPNVTEAFEGSVRLATEGRQHWAYQSIEAPAIPEGRGTWGRKPLDRFVKRKLQQSSLAPSPEASRQTLVRRVYIDLLGIPPSYDDVERFVGDSRADAFERLVDELLSRPEYGERWGRHWLDVARYADAKGYVDAGEVKYPFAFTYRDYVIDSFNVDRPYDDFVRQQLAADRLPGGDPASLAALGFLTVGSRFNFFPHEVIDDRIDVVSRGILGLSVACARCHDHKYDPIPTEDYYTLYSIFAGSEEPTLEQVPTLNQSDQGEADGLDEDLIEAAEEYHQYRVELHQKVAFELRAWAGDYLRYIVQSSPKHRTQAQPELQTKRGLIREVSAYATGAVWRWRRFLESRRVDDPVFGLWVRFWEISKEEIAPSFEEIVDDYQNRQGQNPLILAALKTRSIHSMADVADGYAELLEGVDAEWRAVLEKEPHVKGLNDPHKEEVRMALYAPDAPGSLGIEEAFDYCTLDESVELRKHFAAIERVFLKEWDAVIPRPMMLRDAVGSVSQRVFVRGNPKRLGATVQRAIPSSLGLDEPVPWDEGSGRLELAQAVTSPRHPLTARVIVNRVWRWHFGQGLVPSLSDFGARSQEPTHPQLLDHLASEFMWHGWSLKWLHREILTSATWRQESLDRPEARAVDPENRWLWRQSRRRLDFEAMRDSFLRVSGELSERTGGPPVTRSPEDPENRWRTVYSFVDRENLDDVFRVFDFPSPDISASERAETTVPQQALFLLNNGFVLKQAEVLTSRLGIPRNANIEDSAFVEKLFTEVLGREADAEEMESALVFLKDRSLEDQGALEKARVELAQALLLSNEFLFVD